jgi:hypothetical protein
MANEPDEIELVLKPHPLKETNLNSRRFLKTTANATITHLSKYLLTRLCLEDNMPVASADTTTTTTASNEFTQNDFQLFIGSANGEKFQLLNQNLSLDQCIDQYWKTNNKPLELFYLYIKPNSSNGNAAAAAFEFNNNNNSNSSSISSNSVNSN